MRTFFKISAAVAAAAVLAIWLTWPKSYEYVLIKALSLKSPETGPNREVVWEPGPEKPDVPAEDRTPNIVVILADDLGFNDLTVNGGGLAGGLVGTPNIDSIAKEGIYFANGYAGNATCAPSRAAIVTGRYPTRFGFEFTPAPRQFAKVLHRLTPDSRYFKDREKDHPPFEEMGVPPGEITIAEMLKAKNYRTLMLGKWHLGATPRFQPHAQGFDEWLGFVHGSTMFLPKDHPDVINAMQDFDPIDKFQWANLRFHVQKDGKERFEPAGYLTDYLSDEAVKAIEANKNRPFFMYLSYNAVHTPLQALKSDYDALPQIKDHTTRVYGAMIRALDRGVGRVLQSLKENGLEENTLVFFTSDNGGAHYIGLPDINKPFRGWKATFFEGGMHTPFFLKWPARIPEGTRYKEAVSHFDIFSTAAAAAGISLPSDRTIDGIDLIPYITGEKQGRPHDALFWKSGEYKTVISNGWKLQTENYPMKGWLYHLAEDPFERINLADKHPDKVSELRDLLRKQDKTVVPPIWPSLLEAPVPIDHPGNIPISEDDEIIYWAN